MHSKEADGCRLCRYRRVQEKRPDRDCLNGEVTVYLTLTFVLFVSLILALVESASVQMAKNYRRADMNRALECVFAEYQKELLENYDVFAIECGYETGTYTEQNILDRLSYYGADMENEIERIQLFTDNSGELFRDQVGKYMKHKYGIAWADKYLGNVSLWKNQEEKADEFTGEEEKQNDQLKDLLGEQEAELPEEENPMQHVAELKRSPILELVLPKDKTISEKQISLQEMPEKRENHTGYGAFSDVEPEDGTLTSVLLGEYVIDHFTDFTDGPKGGELDYELEYILEGHASDRENLETVASKLLMVRFVPDYAYIQTDPEKKAEAEAAALTLCTVIGLPELAEGAAQGILLAWAYGEAIMDIRTLVSGGKVPLVKNAEDWKLSLPGLMQLGSAGENVAADSGKDMESGLAYREYLRMLLFLKSQDEVGMRTLDMVEQNLKIRYGQTFFRADACISRVEFHSTCNLRRGIMYDFPTYFGYN